MCVSGTEPPGNWSGCGRKWATRRLRALPGEADLPGWKVSWKICWHEPARIRLGMLMRRRAECTLTGRISEVIETRSGFAEANETRLYYEEDGKGTSLISVHGFAQDRRMWNP